MGSAFHKGLSSSLEHPAKVLSRHIFIFHQNDVNRRQFDTTKFTNRYCVSSDYIMLQKQGKSGIYELMLLIPSVLDSALSRAINILYKMVFKHFKP